MTTQTTTSPASRFGWEGTTLHYTVKAEEATEIKAPEAVKGMDVRIGDMRPVAGGVEAEVTVQITEPTFY